MIVSRDYRIGDYVFCYSKGGPPSKIVGYWEGGFYLVNVDEERDCDILGYDNMSKHELSTDTIPYNGLVHIIPSKHIFPAFKLIKDTKIARLIHKDYEIEYSKLKVPYEGNEGLFK